MGLKRFFMNNKDKLCLDYSKKYLDSKNYEFIEKNFFEGNIAFMQNHLNVSTKFLKNTFYPQVYLLKEKNLQKITSINHEIKKNMLKVTYKEFSQNAKRIIPAYYAREIDNCITIKKAIILSILSENKINIAIVSDKENKNKDIFIDSLREIYPIVATEKSDGFLGIDFENKGAICKSDDGILGLKDFDLITLENEELLKQALEKEVIYAKEKRKAISCEARFKLIATANSKEARFVSSSPEIVNQQISIDKNFFDIVFVLRDIKINQDEKQEEEQIIVQNEFSNSAAELNNSFKKKGKLEEELNYIKDYLIYAESVNVSINDRIKKEMVEALLELSSKYDEKKFLNKVEPKELIQLMVRLAKANTKLSLRREVLTEDVKDAQKIIARSFFAI